jgi:hypothetical protein
MTTESNQTSAESIEQPTAAVKVYRTYVFDAKEAVIHKLWLLAETKVGAEAVVEKTLEPGMEIVDTDALDPRLNGIFAHTMWVPSEPEEVKPPEAEKTTEREWPLYIVVDNRVGSRKSWVVRARFASHARELVTKRTAIADNHLTATQLFSHEKLERGEVEPLPADLWAAPQSPSIKTEPATRLYRVTYKVIVDNNGDKVETTKIKFVRSHSDLHAAECVFAGWIHRPKDITIEVVNAAFGEVFSPFSPLPPQNPMG